MPNIKISSAVLDLLCVDRLMDGGLTGRYGNRQPKSLSSPTTRHECSWGERSYSYYSFSTSAPDGGEWSASRPCLDLAPEKGTPPGYHCTGGWVGPRAAEVRGKILCLCRESNLDLPVVQPVARHYTDWATRLTIRQPLLQILVANVPKMLKIRNKDFLFTCSCRQQAGWLFWWFRRMGPTRFLEPWNSSHVPLLRSLLQLTYLWYFLGTASFSSLLHPRHGGHGSVWLPQLKYGATLYKVSVRVQNTILFLSFSGTRAVPYSEFTTC
jgi:hypothetical protein